MAPRLEACFFVPPGDASFQRMARVLEATATEHCATWQRCIRPLGTSHRKSAIGSVNHAANVHKIERWTEVLQASADGECLLLIDIDTAFVRPIDDVWERPFDLAYTTKRRPFPFNLGVIFVRVSDRTREFFVAWRDENLALLQHKTPEALEWRRRFGGINQASFGRLLERGALSSLAVETLPCREWNCEESGWQMFDPAVTRILHVKGALRRTVFTRQPTTIDLERAATWYQRQLKAVTALSRTA